MKKDLLKTHNIIKDFKIALKDFEPLIKNPSWLRTGRKFSNFSLLVREAWANWLLCVVLRRIGDPDITFMEDETGDGVIIDLKTGYSIPTEHVSRLDVPSKKSLADGEDGVINAINHKISRGMTYAEGKYLVVFFEGVGMFHRNKIRENIRGRHNFKMIYGIGLLNIDTDSKYTYAVTQFHDFHSITHLVIIKDDFTDWDIKILV